MLRVQVYGVFVCSKSTGCIGCSNKLPWAAHAKSNGRQVTCTGSGCSPIRRARSSRAWRYRTCRRCQSHPAATSPCRSRGTPATRPPRCRRRCCRPRRGSRRSACRDRQYLRSSGQGGARRQVLPRTAGQCNPCMSRSRSGIPVAAQLQACALHEHCCMWRAGSPVKLSYSAVPYTGWLQSGFTALQRKHAYAVRA